MPANLTARQVAERLLPEHRISERTLRRRAALGHLPCRRVGQDYRFDPEAVRAALDGRPAIDRAEIRRLVRLEVRRCLAELAGVGAQEGEDK